jgi:hypothetical protein
VGVGNVVRHVVRRNEMKNLVTPNIKRSIKWSDDTHAVPFPYRVETDNGIYCYCKELRCWEEEGHPLIDDGSSWTPCSPLEVILFCSMTGLK